MLDHAQKKKLYGNRLAFQEERYQRGARRFRECFGGDVEMILSAPGRSEICGNHTDHQRGRVLAAAVNLDALAFVRRTSKSQIHIASEGYPELKISLLELDAQPGERGSSAALVRGVASRYQSLGYQIGGFEAYITSDVLPGSGLSSSAAYEVLICAILNHLYNDGRVDGVQNAKISGFAENHFFGKPCGLEDQMACSLGGLIGIDFQDLDSPAVTGVSFDLAAHGYALCILDTGADHAGLTEQYASIPREMGAVARQMGQTHLRFCEEREFYRRIPSLKKACGDRAVLRAMHFFDENRRAAAAVDALKNEDIEEFFQIVASSGRSSHMLLQNVVPAGKDAQELNLALALSGYLLKGKGAYRVHGGGFAGTIQAFVPFDCLEEYRDKMESVFGEGSCHVLSIRPEGAIRVI